VHNLETLYWVREMLERGGAEAFAAQGRMAAAACAASRSRAACANPASSWRRPASPLRELIDEHCGGMLPGHTLYAYLPGGASGGILPAALADVPLDFDTLQPHGCFIGSAAVIVLSRTARLRPRATRRAT
jgi:formate dehydrogenase beta subunit